MLDNSQIQRFKVACSRHRFLLFFGLIQYCIEVHRHVIYSN